MFTYVPKIYKYPKKDEPKHIANEIIKFKTPSNQKYPYILRNKLNEKVYMGRSIFIFISE